MTINADTQTITLFAYGTLRTGERLHNWLENEIIENRGTAVIRGARLYYSTQHDAYPYLVFTGRMSDEAVGELFELPLNDQILSMLAMETNAGYSVSEATATTAEGELPVVVCSWKHEYGKPVPNNDWCSPERKEWWQ